jgi:hypothetical protein
MAGSMPALHGQIKVFESSLLTILSRELTIEI